MFVLPRLLALLLFAPALARAESIPLDANVVWANDSLAVITSENPLPIARGDYLWFTIGEHLAAGGEVTQTPAREVAIVRVAWGALRSEERLERVRIALDRTPAPRRAVLRVGVPASARGNPLFSCARVDVVPPVGRDSIEWLGPRLARLVRRDTLDGAWPDTLLLRRFADAADQEIALERGEIDVGVFWPGELSTAMRRSPRWQGFLYGTRDRGMIVARSAPRSPGVFAADLPALRTLNRDVFRDDLVTMVPWVWTARDGDPSIRFEVDAACPGRSLMERTLNRHPRDLQRSAEPYTVEVSYLDLPPRALAGADSSDATTRLQPLFRLRCPVVFDPGFKDDVVAIGPDAFARLFDCAPDRRR